MKSLGVVLLGLVAAAALVLLLLPPPAVVAPMVRPKIIVPVRPKDDGCRGPFCPRRRPWGESVAGFRSLLSAQVGGRVSPDGVPLAVDYPAPRHLTNLRGSDGLGLCGYASGAMSLDWHGVRDGQSFLQFMTRRPGGAYREKFDKDILAYFKNRGEQCPAYVHYEGPDLAVLDAAVSAGRMVAGTYYRSPTGRYGGQRIAHMVDWVHADGVRYAVLDNNHTGDSNYEWMTRAEAERTIRDERGRMWLVIFLTPPPPPPPHNPKEVV